MNANTIDKVSAGLSGATSILGTALDAAKIKDTNTEQSIIDDLASKETDLGNYDSLEQLFTNTSFANTGYNWKDVRGMNGWQMTGSALGATAQGAMTGLQVAGPWGALGGAVVGLGAGLGGIFAGNAKAKKEANRLNYAGDMANKTFVRNFENSSRNIAMNSKNEALLNIAAFGGPLYPSEFNNGIKFITEGGTHEENPNGGVQQGIAPDGIANLVEEGEVIYNDYVYSKRLKVPKKDFDMLGLKGSKEYTYADAAEAIQKESEERPNDPLSKKNMQAMFGRLQVSQDKLKQEREEAKLKKVLKGLSPEEQTILLQELSKPQQAIPATNYAALGGHLFNVGGEALTGPISYADYKALHPDYTGTENDYIRDTYETWGALFGDNTPLYSVNPANPKVEGSLGQKIGTGKAKGITIDSYGNVQQIGDKRILGKDGKVIGDISGNNSSSNNNLTKYLRAAPVIGSTIHGLMTMFDTPNYSNIETTERKINQVPYVKFPTIGDRMTYTPTNTSYLLTTLGNQNIGMRRAAQEYSAGNSAVAMNNLLAANYQSQLAGANAFLEAEKENLARKAQAQEFNRGTNTFNAEGIFKANQANQALDLSKAEMFYKTGMLRDAELATTQAGKSAALTNMYNNLGNLGTDKLNRTQAQAMAQSLGVTYNDIMKAYESTLSLGGRLRKKGGKHA
jgi:hypothetical protein